MPTVRDLKEHLNEYLDDDDIIAWDLWTTSDVLQRLDDLLFDILDAHVDDEYLPKDFVEARQGIAERVIERMDKEHDAQYGLTWGALDDYLDDALKEAGFYLDDICDTIPKEAADADVR